MGWRNWAVKVVVAANALFTVVLFWLPPSAKAYRWVVPALEVWFVSATILATVLFAANLAGKVSRKRSPKPGWISLIIDGLLILCWVTVGYFLFEALRAAITGAPG